MTKDKNTKSTALSLIELSVIIIIISVIIGGAFSGIGFYRKSIISAAVTLTKSSPIPTIQNLDYG